MLHVMVFFTCSPLSFSSLWFCRIGAPGFGANFSSTGNFWSIIFFGLLYIRCFKCPLSKGCKHWHLTYSQNYVKTLDFSYFLATTWLDPKSGLPGNKPKKSKFAVCRDSFVAGEPHSTFNCPKLWQKTLRSWLNSGWIRSVLPEDFAESTNMGWTGAPINVLVNRKLGWNKLKQP